MNLEKIKKRLEEYYATVTIEKLVSEFEKLGVNLDDLKEPEIKTDGETKRLIIATAKDAALWVIEREDDEELNTDEIQSAIERGIITINEIVAIFKQELIENL